MHQCYLLKNKNIIINYLYLDTVVFKARSLWGRVFPIELEFGSVRFYGGRKTGEPGEKPSEQGREPTTNSTHI